MTRIRVVITRDGKVWRRYRLEDWCERFCPVRELLGDTPLAKARETWAQAVVDYKEELKRLAFLEVPAEEGG